MRKACRPTSSLSTDRPDDDDRAQVGRVVRPHGLSGTVVVELATDRPESRFTQGAVLQTEQGSSLTVERYEATHRSPLLTFEEVKGREAAEELRNVALYIPVAERRPLGEDEFWPDELVGMEVVHSDRSPLGRVTEVETGVGQDRLVVETGEGPVIVPLVTELVPEVDHGAGRITVTLPPGFLD